MEIKRSRSVFLKKETRMLWKHVFPDVFPDACLGFRFGILPPAGHKSRKKHVLWIPFWNLSSGGSKISKKHVPGKKRIYSIYNPYSPISAPYRPLFAPGPISVPYRSHIGPYCYLCMHM